jgi:predicted RNA-binding protein associated with RNAse of E/G family
MARVPQNRSRKIVHTCPICGKKSVPHGGSMEEATQDLIDNGWSWTSALDGGRWHLVCQSHRDPGEPQTLYVDVHQSYDDREQYDPEEHKQHA